MIHGERKRGLKSGTLRDYACTLRTHLLPAFGDQEIEAITREGIRASLVLVQGWMGHSHIQTTARYLHHRAQTSDAALLAEAFRSIHPEAAPAAQPRTHARLASPSPRAS